MGNIDGLWRLFHHFSCRSFSLHLSRYPNNYMIFRIRLYYLIIVSRLEPDGSISYRNFHFITRSRGSNVSLLDDFFHRSIEYCIFIQIHTLVRTTPLFNRRYHLGLMYMHVCTFTHDACLLSLFRSVQFLISPI